MGHLYGLQMKRMNYFIFSLVSAHASFSGHCLAHAEWRLNNGWAATPMLLP